MKPDRFDKIVDNMAMDFFALPDPDALVLTTVQVKKLLRQEHAWFRRMVKDAYTLAVEMELSKQGLADLILTQLTQRRK